MKKLLSILAILGLTTTATTSVVACGKIQTEDNATDLSKVIFQEYTNLVNDNKNINDQEMIDAIKNVQAEILNQLKESITNNITDIDFTTNAADVIIENSDLSAGVDVTITATATSQYLRGKTSIEVIFGSLLDLSALTNTNVEYQTSGVAITEAEAKHRWFNANLETLKAANKSVTIDWFETSNFNPGDEKHNGNVDISANITQNKEFLNISKTSIKTVIKQSGTIDSSVDIPEDKTLDSGCTALIQLTNGTILAGTGSGSIYKLTDEGKIDKKVEDLLGVDSIYQLSNGIILALTYNNANGSIYKLTDEGKIDTSVGNGTGIIERAPFDGPKIRIIELSNGLILVGTSHGSIYKLTAEGKIDTTIGDGTGKIVDGKFYNFGPLSFTQLTNGTIITGTAGKSIYKLTDEGKIDTSVGDGTGIIENETFDGYVTSVFQLSNGTILAGTSWKKDEYFGSIYKLTDEGKIDHSVGDGTGKLEDEDLELGVSNIIQLTNGTILAGTGGHLFYEGKLNGSIYKLVN
ncbi:lipoprotein [Spiroplasma endosymbiont of Labia minor]|uniref:lipoprotein n=1 Tax=Spiroplasma endosymbiont of Labia minor TaxID=3066305 RepID=UPI0030D22B6E